VFQDNIMVRNMAHSFFFRLVNKSEWRPVASVLMRQSWGYAGWPKKQINGKFSFSRLKLY